MHLNSILHGVNNIYGLMIDGKWMGIVTVIVEDNARKPRTASMCLNWNLIGQHSLSKELDVGHMIEYCR